MTYCGYALMDMDRPDIDGNGTYSTHLYTQKAIQVVEDASRSGKVRGFIGMPSTSFERDLASTGWVGVSIM